MCQRDCVKTETHTEGFFTDYTYGMLHAGLATAGLLFAALAVAAVLF